MRARMNQHFAADQLGLICRDLVRERRRRGSRVRRVLIAMPGACHAPVDDTAFSKRTVLMAANIGNCRDLAVVAKDGDPFGSQRYYFRALFRNIVHGTDLDETVPLSSSNSA